MTLVFVLVFVLVYIFIGVVITALMDYPPDESAAFAAGFTILFWPFILVALITDFIVECIYDLVDRFKK